MTLQTVVATLLSRLAGKNPRTPLVDAVKAAAARHVRWGTLATDDLVAALAARVDDTQATRDALYSVCWQLTASVIGVDELAVQVEATGLDLDLDIAPDAWAMRAVPMRWTYPTATD